MKLIFPCCKTELPAPLDGVERVICTCSLVYTPQTIRDWNDMYEIIKSWRDVVNGKAQIICEKGEEKFIANLIRKGIKVLSENIHGGSEESFVFYQDGSYIQVLSGQAWEFENDPDYLVTI